MAQEQTHEQLLQELTMLKSEVAELRAIERIHRQAQEGLQAIELQLASIIHCAMDAIITIDEQQHIVLFNAAAETMFGCSAHECIGHPIDRFLPERFRAVHHHHIQSFRETQVTNRRMGRLGSISGLRVTGEEFPIEASISQVKVASQTLHTVILRDISERKHAEEALQRERDFISAVLETAGALVLVLDTDGHILHFNRACEETSEYTSDEVKGQCLFDLFLIPEEVASAQKIFRQLRDGHRTSAYDHYWVTKSGSRRLITWTNTTLIDNQGSVEYIIATGIDSTEVKQIQEQLRQTERLAELGTLASGMAHEIGTPMNVILGRAEFIMRKSEEETTKKGLGTIITQVERITKIMNQLLSFARRRPMERRPLDLSPIILDMLDVIKERLHKYDIHPTLDLNTNVSQVLADRDQIEQVLLNLLMNAMQAMPHGGTLGIKLVKEQDQVILSVSDTGIGIPPQNVPKLFTPFFTTKDVGDNTGLGLTVVHGIISDHEGTIRVESEPGKGATFHVCLPVYSLEC